MNGIGVAMRGVAAGTGVFLWLLAAWLGWSLGNLQYGPGAAPELVAEFPKVAGICIIVITTMGGALLSWAARR